MTNGPTLNMFQLFLSAYGYEVLVAGNGAEGLELFEKEHPRIVFTDIKMPGVDGFEVLRRVKAKDPRAEVIIITGHGDMDLAVKALSLEATDFINKPIHRAALDEALSKAEARLGAEALGENRVEVSYQQEVAVLNIEGDITGDSRRILENALLEAGQKGPAGITLNFDPKLRVNGDGLAILNTLLNDAKSRSVNVAITGLSENLKLIFQMAGLARLGQIFGSVDEARPRLAGGGVKDGVTYFCRAHY